MSLCLYSDGLEYLQHSILPFSRKMLNLKSALTISSKTVSGFGKSSKLLPTISRIRFGMAGAWLQKSADRFKTVQSCGIFGNAFPNASNTGVSDGMGSVGSQTSCGIKLSGICCHQINV